VKTPPFEFHRAYSAPEAAQLLAELGDDAKIIAGGQSLMPMLAFRLARPAFLVDLNAATELDYVRRDGASLRVGAMTRHRTLEFSTDGLLDGFAVLPRAARWIGHYPIRTRGTVGGSLAHADGAAEWCLMAALLDAEMDVLSVRGSRTVAAAEWFSGIFGTATEADEVLTEVRFTTPRAYGAIAEFARRSGDFALAAAAATFDLDTDGRFTDLAVVLGGVAGKPIRVEATREMTGRIADDAAIRELAAAAADEAHADSHRSRMVQTMVDRALRDALAAGPDIATQAVAS
jgi:carbon-monoxide dehydrogenase medium subunit